MFKRILVLFILLITSISCRQSTAPVLSSPPIEDNGITDGDNTGGGNTEGDNTEGDTGDLLYGYYDVSVLINETIRTNQYRISDTDEIFKIYSNMILNIGISKFKLSKNDNKESYTFDSNLNLTKEGEASYKKFRGVCLVRIYPDAEEKSDNSSLLGCYTIAGVYTEMPAITKNTSRAMIKSEIFPNTGYDELIILRTDKPTDATASSQNTNYRADILFNDDEGISFYYYDPDRTFKYQNTNYIFERIVDETPTE